jgi:hypothetical protein
VIGDRGLGAISRTLIGSVAESVIRQAQGPLFMVHGVDPPSIQYYLKAKVAKCPFHTLVNRAMCASIDQLASASIGECRCAAHRPSVPDSL